MLVPAEDHETSSLPSGSSIPVSHSVYRALQNAACPTAQYAYWDSFYIAIIPHSLNVIFTKNVSSREVNDPLVYIFN